MMKNFQRKFRGSNNIANWSEGYKIALIYIYPLNFLLMDLIKLLRSLLLREQIYQESHVLEPAQAYLFDFSFYN